MKKLIILSLVTTATLFCACNNSKTKAAKEQQDSVSADAAADSMLREAMKTDTLNADTLKKDSVKADGTEKK
ncbi:MAG: hypothetical protein WBP45_04695 [Daejeonella sp.]